MVLLSAHRPILLLAAVCLHWNSGCSGYFFYDDSPSFDSSRRRIDRAAIIGIRSTVTDSRLELDPNLPPPTMPRSKALPEETVQFELLLATPDGPATNEQLEHFYGPVWWACIGPKSDLPPQAEDLIDNLENGCLPHFYGQKYADLKPCEQQHPVVPLHDEQALEDYRVSGLCRLTGTSTTQYTVPWSWDMFRDRGVEIRVAAHRGGGRPGAEACAKALLEQDYPSRDCIFARTRLGIGPQSVLDHIPGANPDDHWDYPGLDIYEDYYDDYEYEPPPESRHFRPQGFEVEIFDAKMQPLHQFSVPLGTPIQVQKNQRIRAFAYVHEEDLQIAFPRYEEDETGEATGADAEDEAYFPDYSYYPYDRAEESIYSSWYHTWGTVMDPRAVHDAQFEHLRDEPGFEKFDTQGWDKLPPVPEALSLGRAQPALLWEAKQERGQPKGGIAHIYTTYRDSLGASTWTTLTVHVQGG